MKKFEVQGVIGMGAYGVVLKAVNKQTKEIRKVPFSISSLLGY